jgi:hypothetical protein
VDWQQVRDLGNRGHNRECRMWQDQGRETVVEFFVENVRPVQSRPQRRRMAELIDLTGNDTEAASDSVTAPEIATRVTRGHGRRGVGFATSDTEAGERVRALLQTQWPL